MFNFTLTYTDLYQLSMAQVYFLKGKTQEKAVFDYFFRKIPYQGGFAIFAGLHDFLELLENLSFSKEDIAYLKTQDFDESFVNYLADFRFSGKIRACQEGEVVFATSPILQVEATIIEAQLIETILLNLLNFQTLIATKASRIKLIAQEKTLLDFGLRRAQGPGGYYASKAAVIGGFDGTSNVSAGKDFNIPISGTMAHSFIQSYDSELEAFRDFATNRPKNCVLLVDTYDTLKSGVPHAISVAKEMEARGNRLLAIRLDSGDLAYFARKSRKLLDDAGLSYVKIAASNQLDEFVIKSLQEQNAPIDIYGVGTNLVIGKPDGALDGVYKLAFAAGKPRIKISESLAKTTIPHRKQVFRTYDEHGNFSGADVIAMEEEVHITQMNHPFEPYKNLKVEHFKQEPLLHVVMENGKKVNPSPSLQEIAAFRKQRLSLLPLEYKRFDNPHIYKVGISDALKQERDKLIRSHKN
ncbi:nicotinate phosphoribosyltransferase [Mesonia oceanica]|uniref:Nicotinate phosphoribosyltransferase pncB2 n=1 Tax=Mesonia oceanica TaxID=2687242 RepID=A0AC61Y3K9_9FLAO|nr:nicotinate phosphoribosyltransferase [Mesonia oceanica]MAQ41491.1 nicotinate phosphoribosyltransferase [Mesonia sp.]VVU99030.1 Nicotinate phosphoribosyltransferase pncB2 [Mesonia oceanica]